MRRARRAKKRSHEEWRQLVGAALNDIGGLGPLTTAGVADGLERYVGDTCRGRLCEWARFWLPSFGYGRIGSPVSNKGFVWGQNGAKTAVEESGVADRDDHPDPLVRSEWLAAIGRQLADQGWPAQVATGDVARPMRALWPGLSKYQIRRRVVTTLRINGYVPRGLDRPGGSMMWARGQSPGEPDTVETEPPRLADAREEGRRAYVDDLRALGARLEVRLEAVRAVLGGLERLDVWSREDPGGKV